jgi:hypothetical protein
MKRFQSNIVALAAGMVMLVGTALAHDEDEAGLPVCLEGNYMMADAMNTPFASANGPGAVIEMNIITGTPGITVPGPFSPLNKDDPDICPPEVVCELGPGGGVGGPFGDGSAPWKPTGVLSGGQNGHAFITSAGQQALTEFHRDGTPIRTVSYKPYTGNPAGPMGFGSVPRPLGTQLMPNGNLIQAICDANFFNASNSDAAPEGGLEANQYFPPVSSTPARAANSRLLVIDQETLEVIDEYSQPAAGDPGHDLWGCAAGIMFDDAGMYISTFHGAAVLQIDWKAGIDNEKSEGVGSNSAKGFKLGKSKNRAVVTDIIDFRLDAKGYSLPASDPSRRDSLRAISFDESGNIYATDRVRSSDCKRGEIGPGGCNPKVFRQRVNIASFDGYNDASLRRSVALDPGVNVIAGIRTNRMSAEACQYVQDNEDLFATVLENDDPGNPYGYAPFEDLCDVETVMVAASAMNPGDILVDDGCSGEHPSGNKCFKPGGGVVEYLTHPNWTDGGIGWGGDKCNGDPDDVTGNLHCALPVARFIYTGPDSDTDPEQKVDPRMLMIIHEAFGQ